MVAPQAQEEWSPICLWDTTTELENKWCNLEMHFLSRIKKISLKYHVRETNPFPHPASNSDTKPTKDHQERRRIFQYLEKNVRITFTTDTLHIPEGLLLVAQPTHKDFVRTTQRTPSPI